MKESTSKAIQAVLAIIYVFIFLAVPMASFGGKGEVTGGDMLSYMDEFELCWATLYLIAPVISIIIALAGGYGARIAGAAIMFIPPLSIIVEINDSYGDVEAGFVITLIIAIAMLIVSIVDYNNASKTGGEENAASSDSTSSDKASDSNMNIWGNEVPSYPENKISEILSNTDMYDVKLVEACRAEAQIRVDMEKFRPQIEAKTDEEIEAFLNNAEQYNPAMIRVCSEIQDARILQAEEAERQRLEAEREAEKIRLEEEAIRRAEANKLFWKKWRIPVIIAFLIFLAINFILIWTSDNHRFKQAMNNMSDIDKSIEYLSMVDNPESKHYCEAKFYLGEQLYAKGDFEGAREAYNAAVASMAWEHMEIYNTIAEYFLNGTHSEVLSIDKKRAADIYAEAPSVYYQYLSGTIYYELGEFAKAYEKFNSVQYSYTAAKGFIGLMYLYGQAGLEANAQMAWEYLEDAPEEKEFFVAKGDLILYRSSNVASMLGNIQDYYTRAYNMYPEREDIKYRLDVINKMISVKAKHDKVSYWDIGKVYWDSYSWDGGRYTGEMTGYSSGGSGSHGWGWTRWTKGTYKNEIYIGHWNYLNRSGLGIDLIPDGKSFYVRVGKYSNNELTNGYKIVGGNIKKIG